MPLQAWTKFEFYDVSHSTMAVRYEGFSGRGSYWMIRPATSPGKSRREQQERALTLLDEAIERGDVPGEVEWSEVPVDATYDFQRQGVW